MAIRGVPQEKNVNLNSTQVNVLESVTRITKKDGGIRTD